MNLNGKLFMKYFAFETAVVLEVVLAKGKYQFYKISSLLLAFTAGDLILAKALLRLILSSEEDSEVNFASIFLEFVLFSIFGHQC